MSRILLAGFACVLFCRGIAGTAGAPPVPVLVELFTSEGCSSCPPADKLLAAIDKDQPYAGVDVIVLSEHVDYWNHLGWSDPFSSAAYSERQRAYARSLKGEVYTPEAVIDGSRGLVGSDQQEIGSAIRAAARSAKTALTVTAVRHGEESVITVHGGAAKGKLLIALAYDRKDSQVLAGENSQRRLSHVAVVYSLREVARLDGKQDVDATVTLKVKDGSRIVAFVSAEGTVTALGHAKV